jgi:glutamate synthase (NADPH/NADH) large chain
MTRGEIGGPLRVEARGAAGQSLGAFLSAGLTLDLEGVANDYVAKGLSGGTVIVRPETDLAVAAAGQAIAGNTCLYGATGGRLHLVGRAGMRFAVRNSGAEAVVEGLGPHGCEYMTGGTVVVLGPLGNNFGAGMTGGRAFLLDPRGHHTSRIDGRSVTVARLADALQRRDDGHLLGDLGDSSSTMPRPDRARPTSCFRRAGRSRETSGSSSRSWLRQPDRNLPASRRAWKPRQPRA